MTDKAGSGVALPRSDAQISEVAAAIEECYELDLSDGLPVVPPTVGALAEMIASGGRSADDIVGAVPPARLPLSVEALAYYAIMAGCEPASMRLLLAAMTALLDPAFNLHGVSTSTAGGTPLLIASGPVVAAAGLNSGVDLLGSGERANVTIGRAVRLVLRNVGGAIPGVLDQAALANPGRYSFCIAEDASTNPWPAMHTTRGFSAGQSVVTAVATMAPCIINHNPGRSPDELLGVVADDMSALGSSNMTGQGEIVVVLGPAHASDIASTGLDRGDVQRMLWHLARRTVGELRAADRLAPEATLWASLPAQPLDQVAEHRASDLPDDALVPACRRPEDVLLLVAGGAAGRTSIIVPTWLDHRSTRSVSVAVE